MKEVGSFNAEIQAKIVDKLEFCWNALHLYGKKPDQFIAVAITFLEYLSEYDGNEIIQAFEKYIKCQRDFPTPSDRDWETKL